ncbi:hypothetical protein LTR27_009974 [Elasticomyces elasticus]|nr:hypothetical protein LTR27_009974 [Elasticomyces elasticus]
MTTVLTGTSAGLGGIALKTILAQNLIPVKSLRISAYNENALPPEIKASGIEVRFGDLNNPESLLRSYEGAEILFLVSFPSVSEERFQLHKNAIDAAKAVGIRHVIYTSLSFGGQKGRTSFAGVLQAHLRMTEYLKASGLTWTIIRMGTYAHLWNNFAGILDVDGSLEPFEVVIPDDGLIIGRIDRIREKRRRRLLRIVYNLLIHAGDRIRLTYVGKLRQSDSITDRIRASLDHRYCQALLSLFWPQGHC